MVVSFFTDGLRRAPVGPDAGMKKGEAGSGSPLDIRVCRRKRREMQMRRRIRLGAEEKQSV
jgi:hypothetical protein